MSLRPMRLTTKQAADLAGVQVDTIKHWRHRGHVKGGPRWVCGRSLLNHLDRRAGHPAI